MHNFEITPLVPAEILEREQAEIAQDLTEYHSEERKAVMKKRLALIAFEITMRQADAA